jgi:hypothetical protein
MLKVSYTASSLVVAGRFRFLYVTVLLKMLAKHQQYQAFLCERRVMMTLRQLTGSHFASPLIVA